MNLSYQERRRDWPDEARQQSAVQLEMCQFLQRKLKDKKLV